MGIFIEVQYARDTDWVKKTIFAYRLSDVISSGELSGEKLYALRMEDGREYSFTEKKWIKK